MCSYTLCSTLILNYSTLLGAKYPYVPASEVQLDESKLRSLAMPKSETMSLVLRVRQNIFA